MTGLSASRADRADAADRDDDRITTTHRIEAFLYRSASVLARTLPLGLQHAAARRLVHLLCAVGERRYSWARTNLEIALPDQSEEERLRIARESFVQWAWNVIDFVRMQRWTPRDIHEHIRLEGLEHLHGALAAGKGAIVLVPHLGNFELGLYALGASGIDCAVIHRPLPNPLLRDEVARSRESNGIEPIHRVGAMARMAETLRKGRVVVTTFDQHSGRSVRSRRAAEGGARGAARVSRRLFVPFFGVRVPTSTAIAILSARTGAPVLPCCVVRDGPDHHRGIILEPLPRRASDDRRAGIELATFGYNAAMESLIRRFPEHWMWAYRRFRHSPDLTDDPYRREVSQWRARLRRLRAPRSRRGSRGSRR